MKLFIFTLFISFGVFSDIKEFLIKSDRSLYIVNGDSISLQMRIADIDTPEIKQKCRQHNKIIDCGRLIQILFTETA